MRIMRVMAYLSSIMFPALQDAQTGDPARPQAKSKPEAYPLGYVEDFDKPKTTLGACFSILLNKKSLPPIGFTRQGRRLARSVVPP
jgi:hypothetical protein